MRFSDYFASVIRLERMKLAEDGDVALEERCHLMLRRAIDIKDQLFALKGQITDQIKIEFLDQELVKIESNQQTLERRLTQAGSLIDDARVYEALNHIEAVNQSLPILTT